MDTLSLKFITIVFIQISIVLLYSIQLAYAISFRIKGDNRLPRQILYSSLTYGGALWLTTLVAN